MNKINLLFLILLGVLHPLSACAKPYQASQEYTYERDLTLFPNPETGVFVHHENTSINKMIRPVAEIEQFLLKQRQKYAASTLTLTYYLGEYKNKKLPATILQRIDRDLAASRKIGFKAIPHFHYAYTYKYEKPMVWEESEKDASVDIIVQHTQQLKEIFKKNADVIAFVNWGQIGPWGEMWISSNWNVGDGKEDWSYTNQNTRRIVAAQLSATPLDRMIIAMPRTKRDIYGKAPLSLKEAFSGTPKSRIGFENNCFLSDTKPGDRTYEKNDYRGPTSYMAVDGLYVPQIAFPDVSDGGNCGYFPTAAEYHAELNKGRWDLIQSGMEEALQKAGDTSSLEDFYKKIGYRYQIDRASFSRATKRGAAFDASLKISNVNGAGIYNPRRIQIILRNKQTKKVYAAEIKGDNKGNRTFFPAPNSSKTWKISVGIPPKMPTGKYEVLINFPDPYPSIGNNPNYSIRLANKNMWEKSTGYNNLKHVIQIDGSAPGAYSGNNWFKAKGSVLQ